MYGPSAPPSNSSPPTPWLRAGTVIPGIPDVVKDTLSLVFNMVPIQQVDFYASGADGWWGASVKLGATGQMGVLLGE